MLLSIADGFDTMNNACIELTSMLAQELGITYGTMCIVCYVIVPALWTIALAASAFLMMQGRKKSGKICFFTGIGILVLMVLYFGIGCARMAAA
ncbi:MAG TPA: hypothetical protein PLL05_03570 [Muribaculaceae bacterium]|nr:hypothetical protein [Muribaculaceae bacterium]